MLNNYFAQTDIIRTFLSRYNLQDSLEDLIIVVYGISRCKFDALKYDEMVELLREKCDYAIMNTNTACLFAALLLIRYEYPYTKITILSDLIYKARGMGFRSRVSNYIAYAMIEEQNLDDILLKSKNMFDKLQEKQGLIAPEDDYISSVYLALTDCEIDESIHRSDEIYKILVHSSSFKRGRALQSLSHMITYLEVGDSLILDKVIEIKNRLDAHKIKFNSSQYLIYALIAYNVDLIDDFIEELSAHSETLLIDEKIQHLKTIEMDVLMIETLKSAYYIEEKERKNHNFFEDKKNRIILLNILIDYLSRQRLL